MKDYRCLKWLCNPLVREKMRLGLRPPGSNDDERALVADPHVAVIGGRHWVVAANGSAIVFVANTVGYTLTYRNATPRQIALIEIFLSCDLRGSAIDFSALRSWVGKSWIGPLPCGRCGGQWAASCGHCLGTGGHRSRCPRCNDAHDCSCSHCKSGVVYCPACVGDQPHQEPVVIRNTVIDRVILSMYLTQLVADRVRIGTPGSVGSLMIEAVDQSWRLAVMPIAVDPTEDMPRWTNP